MIGVERAFTNTKLKYNSNYKSKTQNKNDDRVTGIELGARQTSSVKQTDWSSVNSSISILFQSSFKSHFLFHII